MSLRLHSLIVYIFLSFLIEHLLSFNFNLLLLVHSDINKERKNLSIIHQMLDGEGNITTITATQQQSTVKHSSPFDLIIYFEHLVIVIYK